MRVSSRSFNRRGLSLAEIMIVMLILLPALMITILIFIRCIEFVELSRNTSLALRELKNKLNDVEATTFSQISATFHGVSFTSTGLTGRGICYVETVETDLLRVTTSFSWRQTNGRIIGEDRDLDGVMDAGEDINANGVLDSPAKLVTLIHQL